MERSTRGEAKGQLHVLDRGQERDQVVGLQNKADPFGAKAGPAVVIELIHLLPADGDMSGIGTHQTGD